MNAIVNILLIISLESDNFRTRQQAEEALRAQGIAALPYLTLAENTKSLEARKRIERLKTETVSKYVDTWSHSIQWKMIDSLPFDAANEKPFQYKLQASIKFNKAVYEYDEDMLREATRLWAIDRFYSGETFANILRDLEEE